jgi:uncharacterized repeat protein (TIGR02543 family)
MNTILDSKRHHHVATASIVLIAVSLIAGTVGCIGEETPMYDLTISTTEGGEITSPGDGTFGYDEGTAVPLVAFPHTGYRFVSWTGDVDTIDDVNAAATTIIMNDDYSITAEFGLEQCDLTISSTEGGSVATPQEAASTYDYGTVVDLVATPDNGYQFVSWTGDVATIVDVNAASISVTMNGDYTITANFAKEIWDWYGLDAIRDNPGGSYIVMNDLDTDTAGYTELASPTANGGEGWEPIGSLLVDPFAWYAVHPLDPFIGSLDGQGYEIRDLFVGRPEEDGVGLFGCVGEGVIENLGVVNGEMTGHGYVGGLVGDNRGTVNNAYSTGSMIGEGEGEWAVGGLVAANRGTVSNSHSTGSVTGGSGVGGLVGENWGTVSNSYSTSIVTADGDWDVAGLAGGNPGTVSNSYSTGSVTGGPSVGGLVGGSSGTVSNSYYSYDEVLINGRNIITVGALSSKDFEQWLANDKFLDINERLSKEDGYYLIKDVNDFRSLLAFGQNDALKFRLINDLDLGDEPNFYIPYLAGEFDGNGRKIANLRFGFDFVSKVGLFGHLAYGGKVTGVGAENVNITGCGMVGGLVGENDGTVSNSYITGRVAGYQSVGGLVGWIGWNGGTVSNSHYNYDEVLINGRHIITIGALFNDDFDGWLANDKFLDVNETLSQDDGHYLINDVNDFKELLAFGQYDSLKFRLNNDLDLGDEPNFYIPYLAGEFDGNGHEISNLRLSSDMVVGQVGLFGYLASGGKVSELGVESVDITVTGRGEQVGGLAGASAGTVSKSYSTGSVTGQQEVGGLVGWNKGTVSDSYSTGSVTGPRVGGLVGWNYGGTVSNSYSIGSVTGDIAGGLVGFGNAIVSKSFWDVETSGQATSTDGTGKTTAEMQDIATFSGVAWDIVAVANPGERSPTYIWNIVDGQTYPFLSWQPVS